jgi:serine/threonine-protein kinase HipA
MSRIRAPEARIDTLMRVAEIFGFALGEARRVVADVAHAASGWRESAREHGIESAEIDRMARAFDHDQAQAARSL